MTYATENWGQPGVERPFRRSSGEPCRGVDLRLHVERVTRIELALSAWEADVLPLNYTRGRPPEYLAVFRVGSRPPVSVASRPGSRSLPTAAAPPSVTARSRRPHPWRGTRSRRRPRRSR